MNNVMNGSKESYVFWVTLLGYCFFLFLLIINVWYIPTEMHKQFSNGALSDVATLSCNQMKGCSEIQVLALITPNRVSGKMDFEVNVKTSNPKAVNADVLNAVLDKKKEELPSFLKDKLGAIVIGEINDNRVREFAELRPNWFLSFLAKFA